MWLAFLPLVWGQTGTIDDVKHVVIFMQENRPFDHYYGTLRGVRGFEDRAAPNLPSGLPPFYQPIDAANLSSYQLPYPLVFEKTSATCMPAPMMSYPSDIGIWNKGLVDSWNTARAPGYGMSYFNRTELPYYYALADAFLIGDQYFQSTFTATNPNRLHLFSGSNGLSVNATVNILDDTEPPTGINWETMAETLERANISWKVYQELDNFDDNGFAWFENFINAKPGTPLFDKGLFRYLDMVKEFEKDVANGTLPQVSWLIAPTALSEHAQNHPQDGEDLTARVVKVLAQNKAVYANTVLLFDYDEGGQFFDHHWTPNPPMDPTDGKSTVSPVGELLQEAWGTVPPPNPIGMGFRVPFLIVSPWTRGGLVYSEVCDHTSILKFLEVKFNVTCPNISPWRRAVAGNLLAAFDFASPDYSWPASFPDTSGNVNASRRQCDSLPPPVVPTTQSMPTQEAGTRPSRALPYRLEVTASVNAGKLAVEFSNTGTAGAAFQAYDLLSPKAFPLKYTVEAGKTLQDSWPIQKTYNWSVHGPNGFVRQFSGTDSALCDVKTLFADGSLLLALHCDSEDITSSSIVKVVDNVYGAKEIALAAPQKRNDFQLPIAQNGNWYDFSVTVASKSQAVYSRRLMGRMETGEDSISDPAIGGGQVHRQWPVNHPPVPAFMREFAGWSYSTDCASRRSKHKDSCALENLP